MSLAVSILGGERGGSWLFAAAGGSGGDFSVFHNTMLSVSFVIRSSTAAVSITDGTMLSGKEHITQ